VEAYRRDGFLVGEDVQLVASYVDGNFVTRQFVLFAALMKYTWLLTTKRVELVHAHAAMRGSFWRKGLFSSIARLCRIPVILHLHGSEMKPFYESQPEFLKRQIRGHLEKATRVLVLSESWREYISGIAPAANIIIVPNYVLVPEIELARPGMEKNILFLGLIGPRKGTFDLIRAFASVVKRHPNARLIIGGNGQVEEATRLVQSLGIQDRVELVGWVNGKEKERLLRKSSIYVLPSYNEGLPMSVLEAMAANLAVVTTRVGGIPELITTGTNGLLIEPGDEETMAQHMDTLLSDENLRVSLAAAGRQRVESHYSPGAVLPLLKEIYHEAAGSQTARSKDDKAITARLSGE
jgi:glycosyltransferase involved in cell wall biosynthesis